MHTIYYRSAIDKAAELAPALPLTTGKTNNFFQWVEDISQLLSYIYLVELETVLEDLVEKVKEVQDYEDQ